MKHSIIASDIGGTNARFAAFSVSSRDGLVQESQVWIPTASVKSFPELLDAVDESALSVRVSDASFISIAIAGPVEGGVFCKPPLIPWNVDLRKVEGRIRLSDTLLINDFLAQAYASRSPLAKTARKILDGVVVTDGTTAVIGAGTGLGKAFILPTSAGGFVAGASEGGHVNFSAENREEVEFQEFVCRKKSRAYATWNDIVTGSGLALVHEFLTGNVLSPKEIASHFSDFPNTLEWFSRFYGRVSRNFALETLAYGGLYVAGGVAVRNPEILEHDAFEASFRSSFHHEKLLSQIPVFLIESEESGLWGAAFAAALKLNLKGI